MARIGLEDLKVIRQIAVKMAKRDRLTNRAI
jgi:hypothetical protein